MNIIALSTAQKSAMHAGTTLFLDDISLDYTVAVKEQKLQKEIDIYQDKETQRLLAFFEFTEPQLTSIALYNMMGNKMAELPFSMIQNERKVIPYGTFPQGIYLLEILHSGKKFCKKFFLNY